MATDSPEPEGGRVGAALGRLGELRVTARGQLGRLGKLAATLRDQLSGFAEPGSTLHASWARLVRRSAALRGRAIRMTETPPTLTAGEGRLGLVAMLLGVVVVAALGGWLVGSWIESPAEAAARAAPPRPSPILVPVEWRTLRSRVVTRGTARFGLPQPVAIAPSSLKPAPGLITTLPLRNAEIREGAALLSASGRPLFVLEGALPVYRDLVPGIRGEDVRQLQVALARLGVEPGDPSGVYDEATSAAVERWYRAAGQEPFGPTPEQRARVHALELDAAEAAKLEVAAVRAAKAADVAVEAARARAAHDGRLAATELESLRTGPGAELAVARERARAEHVETAAEADIAATVAERARVVLDPRQPETARKAADARLELARSSAEKARIEAELAVRAAEREAALGSGRLEQAEAALRAAKLAGELAVRAAIDAREVARLDARLARDRAARLADELERARASLGVQVPADELVLLPSLPVRVEEVTARVGDVARGPVLSVTDNQVAVDSALPLEAAPLVSPGMRVEIDEPTLGIEATGTVRFVAARPGTRGVDGYHIYYEVAVDPTPTTLEGYSLRLTIPIESTDGEVLAIPTSALSLGSDGGSRVEVERDGRLETLVVEPGLAADGFVAVRPKEGSLEAGELVVVGYDYPGSAAP